MNELLLFRAEKLQLFLLCIEVQYSIIALQCISIIILLLLQCNNIILHLGLHNISKTCSCHTSIMARLISVVSNTFNPNFPKSFFIFILMLLLSSFMSSSISVTKNINVLYGHRGQWESIRQARWVTGSRTTQL